MAVRPVLVMLGWVAGLGAGGCYAPDLPVGLPCTTEHRCPDGQTCDPATDTCVAPSTEQVWRDDLAADFAAPGAVFEDTVVEQPGVVGPTPYLTGGLRQAAVPARLFDSIASAAWAAVATATPSGRGFLRGGDFDVGVGRPLGVGVTAVDDVTVWLEGELFLEAGAWRVMLWASDVGFVDIAVGDAGFTRLVTASDASSDTADLVVPVTGWYPIRGAVADAADELYFDLETEAPGDAGFSDIPGDRLRARVDDLSGVALDGFDDPWTLGPTATTLATSALAAVRFDDDLDLGDGEWSQRWAGQVRIDQAGAYVLRFDSFGGHRVWVDGVEVIDDLGYVATRNDTPALTLDAGWHDLVIELMWTSDEPPRLAMTVASGPELVGASFPVDRTRPVIGRGVRWAYGSSWPTVAIPDDGTAASLDVWVGAPAGARPLSAEVRLHVSHPVLASLAASAEPPAAGARSLWSAGDLTGAGADSAHASFGASAGARGTWTFRATDATVDTMTGALEGAQVTATYAGAGVAPFPTTSRFTSAVHDLGRVTSLGALRWSLRQGDHGGAVVSLRTCDAVDACAAEAWTVVELGATPAVTARRFAQYQVDLTCDGDVPTALDWIELGYRAGS